MKRVLSIAAVALAIVAMLAAFGCSSTATTTPATAPAASTGPSSFAAGVSIVNMAFAPLQVTVKVGETVQWTNNDTVAHTVTGADFDSGQLAPGAIYTHTFTKPGVFNYKCTNHPTMLGSVTVAG
jgi:plastocyanin